MKRYDYMAGTEDSSFGLCASPSSSSNEEDFQLIQVSMDVITASRIVLTVGDFYLQLVSLEFEMCIPRIQGKNVLSCRTKMLRTSGVSKIIGVELNTHRP